MKFDRNVPAMVFFRISWKNVIPLKTLVAMATKFIFEIFENLLVRNHKALELPNFACSFT